MKKLATVLVLILVGITLAGAQDIKIGGIGPVTGEAATFGVSTKNGMLMAVEMWVKRDHAQEWKQYIARLNHVADRVKRLDSVARAERQVEDNQVRRHRDQSVDQFIQNRHCLNTAAQSR